MLQPASPPADSELAFNVSVGCTRSLAAKVWSEHGVWVVPLFCLLATRPPKKRGSRESYGAQGLGFWGVEFSGLGVLVLGFRFWGLGFGVLGF